MRIPLNELLSALSGALDYVERELLGVTTHHGKRAAYVSARICQALGMSREEVFDMAACAILHDNALTMYMRQAGPEALPRLEKFENHCERGEENARAFPFFGDTAGIILHHHENWNGTGFHKLTGEQIPLRAAALRLADNLDLRLGMGDGRAGLEGEIRDHLARFKGTLYSPVCVEALLGVLDHDFIRDISDDAIGSSYRNLVPGLRRDISAEEMLRLCEVFALIIDAKSPFTMTHSHGVAVRVGQLAEVCGLQGGHRDKLVIGAYLHDLGKLATPQAVLEKTAPLTPEEWSVMKDHAVKTTELLGEVSGIADIASWAGNHHEKLNGRGYPRGLTGEDLDFESRLVACCDVYQALTEDRPYRQGMPHEKAMWLIGDMAQKGELDFGLATLAGEVFAPENQACAEESPRPPSAAGLVLDAKRGTDGA